MNALSFGSVELYREIEIIKKGRGKGVLKLNVKKERKTQEKIK